MKFLQNNGKLHNTIPLNQGKGSFVLLKGINNKDQKYHC
jgi:hypothetical protein